MTASTSPISFTCSALGFEVPRARVVTEGSRSNVRRKKRERVTFFRSLDAQPWPAGAVGRRLLVEQIAIGRQGIHCEQALVQQREAVWCVQLTRSDADAGRQNQEAVDPIARRAQLLIRVPEERLVPNVNPSLIGHFHGDTQVRQHVVYACLYAPLSGLARVVAVEIEQVVVLDIRLRRTPGLEIPYRLKQAAGHQPSVGQGQLAPAVEDDAVVVVSENVSDETLVHRVELRFRPVGAMSAV